MFSVCIEDRVTVHTRVTHGHAAEMQTFRPSGLCSVLACSGADELPFGWSHLMYPLNNHIK